MDIFNFLAALARSEDESDPYVVHRRAMYQLSQCDPKMSELDLAQKITCDSQGDFLVLYAADAFGGVKDFLVASRTCDCTELHALLQQLTDEPQSTCGSGELPHYVKQWLKGVGCAA